MTRGFLLDTNIPSEQIRKLPDPRVGEWLNIQPEESLFLSAITIGELRKGIVLLEASKRRDIIERWFEDYLVVRFAHRILPVTQNIGDRWGALAASRRIAGAPLSPTDGLIAATAAEHDLTMVTRNVKDFRGLGLATFSPWD